MKKLNQISKKAIEQYPVLEIYSSILIKSPNRVIPNVKVEKVLEFAELFKVQYEAMEQLALDDEAMYEEVEEWMGTGQAEFITRLAYYVGLTEVVEFGK